MLFQYPCARGNQLLFAGNNRLWTVPFAGGKPGRLGDVYEDLRYPCYSPDGEWIAFTAKNSIYIQDAHGSTARCLLKITTPVSWIQWVSNNLLWFASTWRSPMGESQLYCLDRHSRAIYPLNLGSCQTISLAPGYPQNGVFCKSPELAPQQGANENVFDSMHSQGIAANNQADVFKISWPCVIQCGGRLRYGSWKNYQGGDRGKLWIDIDGSGAFQPLLPDSTHTLVNPVWVKHNDQDRIYFASDMKGVGNIFSATPRGGDLRQHTHHQDFCVYHHTLVQNPENRHEDFLVYSCGGDIFKLPLMHLSAGSMMDSATDSMADSAAGKTPDAVKIAVEDRGQDAAEKALEEKNPMSHLNDISVHPKGGMLGIITRGRLFRMQGKKGVNKQLGTVDGARYRLSQWLHDGTLCAVGSKAEPTSELTTDLASNLASASDSTHLVDFWEVYPPNLATKDSTKENAKNTINTPGAESGDRNITSDTLLAVSSVPAVPGSISGPETMTFPGLGRATAMLAHPKKSQVACTNARHELWIVDVAEKAARLVDRSTFGAITGFHWSPCGQWLAYQRGDTLTGSSICIWDTDKEEIKVLIQDGFHNTQPVFDPKGQYLYFLSARVFKPASDSLALSMGCDNMVKIMVAVLNNTASAPFVLPFLKELADKDAEEDGGDEKEGEKETNTESPQDDAFEKGTESAKTKEDKSPVKTVIQWDAIGNRILEMPWPAKEYFGLWALPNNNLMVAVPGEEGDGFDLVLLDDKTMKEETLAEGIDHVYMSPNDAWMVYCKKQEIHHLAAGTKQEVGEANLVNLSKLYLMVQPIGDYRFTFDEAWDLQRKFFWDKDMTGIDWDAVYKRYHPMAQRVSCVEELAGVLWDMQGELCTSHAYVMFTGSGSAKHASLGADLTYNWQHKGYQVQHIIQGPEGEPRPLGRPGIQAIDAGDIIVAIQGYPVTPEVHPHDMLKGKAGDGVWISVEKPGMGKSRDVLVFPISASKEKELRYQERIEKNRQYAHDKSQKRLGYVPIPDMQAYGYGTFLKYFWREFDADGLVVDARYNGGGNLSPLVVDLLHRRRLGYDQTRHHGKIPYPAISPRGPMVLLINGMTGSDGDIFSQCFRSLNLGPIVGTTTWGGIVGIWPRHGALMEDCIITTQPEFAFFFSDQEGWVEGHGVKPDFVVENTPNAARNGEDPQLDFAIEKVMGLLGVETNALAPRTET